MALFRSEYDDGSAQLNFGAVSLRAPKVEDYEDWARLRASSMAFLQPWEPKWAKDELTHSAFKRRVRRYHEDRLRTSGYAFFVFRQSDQQLVGGCNLSNVRRGVSQTATLGYWIGVNFQRQGLTRDAVQAICNYCFDDLNLHRIEAACIPDNIPSQQLLEQSGFVAEGLARDYLKIADKWQDHQLFSKLAPSA
ncbi:MAG: 30S ribosomal protein S5 alanine N-acetyltransferase [Robiginitomaculum sp.]|nr:MAG: 30S ribosomal protein S5 alanine N-acetyltransferase [Robiginitomaculum sp.]